MGVEVGDDGVVFDGDLARMDGYGADAELVEALAHPVHLSAVGLGFVGDDDGNEGVFHAALGNQRAGQLGDQPALVAEYGVADVAVADGEGVDQADAAGDGVEFGGDEAVLADGHEIGSDDDRQAGLEPVQAGEFKGLVGLTAIEQLGDPGGLGASGAGQVETVGDDVELKQVLAHRLEGRGLGGRDSDGLGGEPPGDS